MTKKNFVALAKMISNMDGVPKEYKQIFAMNLASYFSRENPNFDVYRFINACNIGENNEGV